MFSYHFSIYPYRGKKNLFDALTEVLLEQVMLWLKLSAFFWHKNCMKQ